MNDKNLHLIFKILSWIIGLSGVILAIAIYMGEGKDELGRKIHDESTISFSIQFTWWLMILIGLIAVVAGVILVALNLKKSIPLLIGLGLFALCIIIGYSISTDELMEEWKYKANADLFTPANAKWGDMSIKTMYIFSFISIVAIVAGEAYSIYKRFSK